jgi:hypothetical protein
MEKQRFSFWGQSGTRLRLPGPAAIASPVWAGAADDRRQRARSRPRRIGAQHLAFRLL